MHGVGSDDDCLGTARLQPTRGLAPGCPMATDWLALLMLCWRSRVLARGPEVVARDYVDDLVTTSAGADAPDFGFGFGFGCWRLASMI